MDIYLQRNNFGGFNPAHGSDSDQIKKLSKDQVLKAKITRPRNYQFHKKFFAMLNLTFDNQEHYDNFDLFREDVMIQAGYCIRWQGFMGTSGVKAKSISFAKMDEEEFEKVYSGCLNICYDVIGIKDDESKEMMREQILEFM